MIRAKDENLKWWASLSQLERCNILEEMLDSELCSTARRDFAESMLKKINKGQVPSDKQLVILRDWHEAL